MKLSIIMYHYVRELRHTRFPEIKGLDTNEFREQIGYIKRHYQVIGGDDLLQAVAAGEPLPPRALLLTFDDGYLDHFTDVFPILDREGITGCFFPPARCVLERRVLNVNKIHFILASAGNKSALVDFIFKMLDEHGAAFELENKEHYWNKLAIPGRYDPKEVIFVKRMLQRELPERLREIIVEELFRKYVSANEAAFARELYMSIEQIQCLRRQGMYIGSHGFGHYWLDSLPPAEQEEEIDLSLDFLRKIDERPTSWIMCYPYGAHNESLLSILRQRGCTVGLTTQTGIADLSSDNLLKLPRLDTNDLPKSTAAEANQWTRQVCGGK